MKRHYVKHHGSEIGSHGDLRELLELTFRHEKLEIASGSGDGNGTGLDSGRQPWIGNTARIDETDFLDCNMNVNQRGGKTFDIRVGVNNGHPTISMFNRNASNVKLYRCSQCNFVCDVSSKVKSHMEIHENLKRFVCTVCGKRSNWMWNVRKHIRKRHPGADLTIRELSETDAKNTLDAYLAVRQPNRRATIPSIEKLEGNEQKSWDGPNDKTTGLFGKEEKHLSMEIESLAEQYANDVAAMFYGNTGCRDLSCPSAAQASSGECSMEIFSQLAASQATSGKKSVRMTSAAAKRFRPYKCSQCGRRSNWRWDLNKHIRASHPTAHLIELTGSEARATFHEVLHRDPKEKSSAVVGSKIRDASAAWKHCHKPYQCTACGHRSNWKCDLYKHIRALHPSAGVVTLDDKHARDTLDAYDRAHAVLKPLRNKVFI